MVITFPHMGRVYISVKALFDDLNVKLVVPPPVSKNTLELGTRLAPEMACLPLKISIGNYIESIKRGADTIILTGSCGPCRFGYYGVVQKEILKDLGYDVNIVILDAPNTGFKAFIDKIRMISGYSSLSSLMRAFRAAFKVTVEVDELMDIVLRKRPREKHKGETDRLLSRFEHDVLKVHGSTETLELVAIYKDKISVIAEDEKADPVRIGLVGEIYTLIEPYVNLNVEKKLGSLGVEVHRGITLTDWIKTHLSMDMKYKRARRNALDKAKPYLGRCIGGHAWETIAATVGFNEKGMDGVIQILPFGCMPEIVAESIIPTISRDLSLPAMTVTVDELTGEAGYMTRLEAFVDLLSQKKGMVS
ncbi:MAG TPA: CoA protein activase [Candidatus Atribacteria bacterium]|nr:CoA protein activase [Candidatus Atribacteria bacterium]